MARKGLSNFANYCRDRDIRVTFRGRDGDTLLFDVRTPRHGFTPRKRKNFEGRLHEDNPGTQCDIRYLALAAALGRRESDARDI